MRKISLLPLFALILSSPVLAGGYRHGGWAVFKVFIFLAGVLLFCIIFWWTYVWIVQDKGKLFKAKKK